jgi:hypothetical protein
MNMLLSAVYEKYTRDQLEGMLYDNQLEISRLKDSITCLAEELTTPSGKDVSQIVSEAVDYQRKYTPGYCIGSYNQMNMYIGNLESALGRTVATVIRGETYRRFTQHPEFLKPVRGE